MAKRIVGALALLLILGGFLTCKNPLHKFDNPVDPDSDDYIGVPSEDNDGDGINRYEDVDEIVLISPENEATVSELPLLLTVYKFNPEKVKQYWIQVSTDESFSATVVNKNDYSSNECAVSSGIIENNTSYYWRAKAYDGSKWSDNWSETRSLTITIDIAPPTTPSPSNGSTIIDTTPFLDWEDVASSTVYHIQVNTNSDFTGTVIADDDTLNASQYPITEALSDNTTYYWHVRIKNEDGVWGDWSSTWSFSVDMEEPTTPSPSNGSTIRDTTPLLDWEDVASAAGYHIEVNTNSDFTGTVIADVDTLTASQYPITAALSDNTTYYWHVKIKNEDVVWGDWSRTWAFTVTPITEIAAGAVYSLALNSDGTVWAWGYNNFGQLGDSTFTIRASPVQVHDLTSVISIAAGHYHSLALMNDRTIWAWGGNQYGQLGDGTTIWGRNTPVQVSSLTSVISVAGGARHSVALKSDGTVWAWGYNGSGQLGNGSTANSTTPVSVSSLAGIIAIAAGDLHSVALKSDGTVWAWGYNYNGQLGNGSTTYSTTPVSVSSLAGIIAIAAGGGHNLALKSDGTVWAWGYNYNGQLGNGFTTDSTTPVLVTGPTGVIAIASADNHNFAVESEELVWAWGYNYHGELGNGTTTVNIPTPVQVSNLNGFKTFAGGGMHSLGLKSDGTVWAWGHNHVGQLGDGTYADHSTPVQVTL